MVAASPTAVGPPHSRVLSHFDAVCGYKNISGGNTTKKHMAPLLPGARPIANMPHKRTKSPACDVASRYQNPAFTHGRRVLLIMCKRAFRGHQGMLRLLRQSAHPAATGLAFNRSNQALIESIECSREAVAIQRATSLAQDKLLIRPLESAGFTVDVIISAAVMCSQPKFIKEQRARLGEYYGKHRLVGVDVYAAPATQAQTMLRALRNVQDHFRKYVIGVRDAELDSQGRRKPFKKPIAYHSVLFWRFDVVPIRPIATVGAPTGPPPTRAAIRQLMHSNATAGLYPLWAREFIASHGGDILLSIPGWMMPCVLPKLQVCCGRAQDATGKRRDTREGVCDADIDARLGRRVGNFCENSFITRQLSTWTKQMPGRADPSDSGILSARERTWVAALAFRAPPIYRGPIGAFSFAGGAMRTCRFLRMHYDGPLCDARHVLAQGCSAVTAALVARGLTGERLHVERVEWMMRLWHLSRLTKASTCLATFDDTPNQRVATNEFLEEHHEATACLPRGEKSNCTRADSDPWMYVDVLTHAAAPISFRSRCPARLVIDDRLVGMTQARSLILSGSNKIESRAQLCMHLMDFTRTPKTSTTGAWQPSFLKHSTGVQGLQSLGGL